MSEVKTSSGIDEIHGKLQGTDRGYFYMRNGKQFYRNREETYPKKQSPKQEYNSEAFAYANSYMAQHYGTPETKALLTSEYEAANHIATNGKTYSTAWSWKFNSLQHDWKTAHPFAQLKRIIENS